MKPQFAGKTVRLLPPSFDLLGKRISSFRFCGSTGLLFAIALATVLTLHANRSIWVLVGLLGVAVSTFFVLILARKAVTGEETIIYYHHEIGIMTACGLFLIATGQPLLPYLDITILAIGLFLVCGRIGCLMVGCCHGRPCRLGVRYRQEHAAAGFPSYLVGVRLFPVQALESLWVLLVVAVGAAMVWRYGPPGSALAWYVVVYDLGRFFLEFARGDAERPYWHGFSQAQWIALILTAGIAVAEIRGYVPFHAWHIAAAILLALAMCVISIRRRSENARRFELLLPAHVKELASARMALLSGPAKPGAIEVFRTSLGVQVSGGEIRDYANCIRHYSLSFARGDDDGAAAKAAAKLMLQLESVEEDSGRHSRLIPGDGGVFHLLVEGRNPPNA